MTAEAGAAVLREGGNAVDAAVAAVMASCVTESPLTGLGAGGYMLVHTGSETTVLDFFVAVPGADGVQRRSELVPVPIHFTAESSQVFHVGAASCGVPGVPAGLERALELYGSVPLAELAAPAAALARDGVILNREAAYFLEILAPILTHYDEARAVYAPDGNTLASARRSAGRTSATRWRRSAPTARSRSIAASPRGGSQIGWSTAAGPSGRPTWRPTSRSRASRSRRAFATARCSPTRRPRRAGS